MPQFRTDEHPSYLIIIKGLMPNVVAALYHVLLPSDPPAWSLSGRVWISLFMIVLVPLCFLRDLHSLRHTSYIALFSVGKPNPHFNLIRYSDKLLSISCRRCRLLLHCTTKRHRATRRSSSHSFYTVVCRHIPSPGVRLYMCSECA